MNREQIQDQITEEIIVNGFKGIIHVSPRVGKTKCVVDAINKLEDIEQEISKILISVPRNAIIDSWLNEFKKWVLDPLINIELINKASLHKKIHETYDIIILDEIHDLSDFQIESVKKLKENGNKIFGMSGSISDKSKKQLKQELDLDIIAEYSIEDAIRDGIISNYEIIVHKIPLNNSIKYITGGTKKYPRIVTEQEQYDYLCKKISRARNEIERLLYERRKIPALNYTDNVSEEIKFKQIYERKRMNLIYEVGSKWSKAKKLISSINDRTLIFTTRTKIADKLCDNSFHSKSNKENLQRFKDKEINKLAVCNMASMGITVSDLKVGVIHQILSNEEDTIQKLLRMCNLEGDKKAVIHIMVCKDTVDEKWLENSLKPFPNEKIKYYEL